MITRHWFYNYYLRNIFRVKLLIVGLLFNHSILAQSTLHQALARGLDYEVGRALFEKNWVSSPSSTTASDGLGPLYNARSCAQCHEENRVVVQINSDVYGQQLQTFGVAGLPAEASVNITYSPLVQTLSSEEEVVLQQPLYHLERLRYGELNSSVMSPRRAASLAGIGLLETIPEDAIALLEDVNDDDGNGISGRMSKVWDNDQNTYVLGRFGWKAQQPNLKVQIARALSLDMGLSSSLYPEPSGDCTLRQSDCLSMPHGNSAHQDGFEVSNVMLNSLLLYVSQLPLPLSKQTDPRVLKVGGNLFKTLGCGNCHQPEFMTLGQELRPYSDLLLHDMGEALADNSTVRNLSSEWRTMPLWGLSERKQYLHDGRANSIIEAILWHGGEATKSVEQFTSLSAQQRQVLIDFLSRL